ncbi:sodium/hydrogen exchanger [Oceaniovalibus guishaninsula JLT2003]|uniref:Sodium/hydrogen exchanger n=1 Tax=Oceaniovalibus guishaninsula JLT2003 TaxID=1231392 RepID=K2I8B3_9RHOB|nr:sodium:proton antiporter [Oceaniovalibus guishaninsula]EKE45285.1 sodium/hydrogen exchanger [Oceaniovalibus guishaninsula JLT2003]
MSVLQIASSLIVLAGLFGSINYLFLRLPSSIGILIVSLLASILLLAVGTLFPGLMLDDAVRETVRDIEFSRSLLDGMLGLLLFAGALHVKIEDLRAEWPVVLLMATLGVALSTLVVGIGFSWVTGMPLLLALVFGALISPTDPVAVLSVLRQADLPRSLETQIAGESLFNDGVGYVVFLILIGMAVPTPEHHASGLSAAATLFLREAVGGAVLGLVLGFATFRLMRLIDDYSLEVLLTLGLAFGGYELAVALGVSAPIMAVCAGLLIGDVGARRGMSAETRRYVDGFWRLIDEILNAVLFLMIGIEVFAIVFDGDTVLTGLAAVILSLVARLTAVLIPVLLLRPFRGFENGVVRVMTWGGLKGGISVALALSLPETEWTPLILTSTYIVVVFSIVVQGLTVGTLARRIAADPGPATGS